MDARATLKIHFVSFYLTLCVELYHSYLGYFEFVYCVDLKGMRICYLANLAYYPNKTFLRTK